MPAFTYVASVIVANVVGITGAAILGSAGVAFVTSAIALGLAYTTARVLGVTGGAGGTTQDPGVRIQFPPATNNKVPIVYGTANTKGLITDARISNENKTMTYVLVLSEKTQTGTFSIGDIYWNDQKLVFDTDAGESHIVRSSVDQNGAGETNTNYDGLMRFRVYSGSTAASDQIFPPQATGNTENARTLLGESDTNYLLNGLVFAVVQIDYNSEKGITGLGQVTFQVSNTLKNPGSVWKDYMTSARYGAGYSEDQIDLNSSTSTGNPYSLYNWSNTVPDNQYESDGTTPSTQVRYEINGVLSTGDTVKNNIDRISQAANAWTSYDFTQGKWRVILNRAATETEVDEAFVFNDDNIIGEVGVTATNLEDMYNLLEVEFASRKMRDQNDYFRGEIDPSLRNDLEPNNTLNVRIDCVNNALHAARVGLIEIKSSRADLVVTFTADHSALQCQAGDVVKITNSVYGFTNKLFRLTKLREVENEDGSIVVEVTALQYDGDVYTDEILVDSPDTPGNNIPVFGGSSTLPAPSAPVLSNINTSTNTFTISTDISGTSGPVDEVQWFYSSTSTSGTFVYLTNEYSPTGNFGAGTTVSDNIITLPNGQWFFKARTGLGSRYSNLSDTSDPLDL